MSKILTLTANLHYVEEKIKQACEKSHRNFNNIKIIAVTKYVDAKQTKNVLELGIQHIGENKVQHAIPKWEELSPQGTWHFIGHLQTNKVKQVIGKFDYIHSLDRLSLAESIQKQAAKLQIKVKTFIQVNVSGEESKGGVEPEELLHFCKEMHQYPNIAIVGLMTMAPNTEDKEEVRKVFRRLRELKDLINNNEIFPEPLTELSMGMSNDFEVAVEEGATFVRLGTILLK